MLQLLGEYIVSMHALSEIDAQFMMKYRPSILNYKNSGQCFMNVMGALLVSNR